MKNNVFLFGWVVLCIFFASCGTKMGAPQLQDSEQIVAFYNVENLFDTIDAPGIQDEDFLPSSQLAWNTEKYETKLLRLATVIRGLGYPVLMGMSEVENRSVLEDLINHDLLAEQDYEIAHLESSDSRGIDCALLYKGAYFSVNEMQLVRAYDRSADHPGREQLLVHGQWHYGQNTTVAVNHWPSRNGGVDKTERKRISAARNLFLSLMNENDIDSDYIIIMGDFNDEPTNISVNRTLNAGSPADREDYRFVNLSYSEDEKNEGSYNYRGNWNMLDQIIVSKPFMDCADGLCAKNAKVYKPQELLFRHPRFGLSPNRTAGGPNYYGGYSDHLPVYSIIQIPDVES